MNYKWLRYLLTEAKEKPLLDITNFKKFRETFAPVFLKPGFKKQLIKDITHDMAMIIKDRFVTFEKRRLKNEFDKFKKTGVWNFDYHIKKENVYGVKDCFANHENYYQYLLAADFPYFLERIFLRVDNEFVSTGMFDFSGFCFKFYRKHPELIPQAPVLNKTKTNVKGVLDHNVKVIESVYSDIDRNAIANTPILNQLKIGKKIGSGAYGKVFEIEDSNFALKIFSGIYNQGDIKRMEDIEKQLYSGQASLEDMHFYEHGEIGNSGYKFALMPKIIPFASSYIGKKEEDFFDFIFRTCYNNLHGVHDPHQQSGASYDEFRERIYDKFESQIDYYKYKGYRSKIAHYSQIVNAIIKAVYRASKLFGGTDLHSGNIGFFANKPYQFFFFDM